jgi:hypothetical protein
MAYEQRDNSGSMFVNDKKETDNHPDRTGTAMIGGVEYWVSGWLKKSAKGQPFMSLAFKAKEEKRQEAPRRGGGGGSVDDDVPFSDPLRGVRALVS